jgi:hypothetical protein
LPAAAAATSLTRLCRLAGERRTALPELDSCATTAVSSILFSSSFSVTLFRSRRHSRELRENKISTIEQNLGFEENSGPFAGRR